MQTDIEGDFGVVKVRHQRRHPQAWDGHRVTYDVGTVGHLGQRPRRDERPNLYVLQPSGRESVDPAALCRRRHRLLQRLEPVAWADLDNRNVMSLERLNDHRTRVTTAAEESD